MLTVTNDKRHHTVLYHTHTLRQCFSQQLDNYIDFIVIHSLTLIFKETLNIQTLCVGVGCIFSLGFLFIPWAILVAALYFRYIVSNRC